MAQAPSILEVLIARGGVMKGARVAAFVVMWAVTADDLGREPSTAEVIDWWGEKPRTVWRYLAEFRELVPELGEHATPQPFVALVQEHAAVKLTRRVNAGLLGRVPAPSLVAA